MPNKHHRTLTDSRFFVIAICLFFSIMVMVAQHYFLPTQSTSIIHATELSCSEQIRLLNVGDAVVVGDGSEQMDGYRQMLFHLLHGTGHDVLFVGEFQDASRDNFPAAATGYQAEQTLTADGAADNLFDWLTMQSPDIVLLHVKDSVHSLETEHFARLLSELERYEVANETAVSLYVATVINEIQNDPAINQYNEAITSRLAEAGRADWQMVNLESVLNYQNDMSSANMPNDLGYAKLARTWANSLLNDNTLNLPRCLPLSLRHTIDPAQTINGETIFHHFDFANLATDDLTDVTLTVSPESAACQFRTLAELTSGPQQRLSCETISSQHQLYFATMQGTHPISGTVSNSSLGFVGVVQPSLSVSKTTSTPIILSGAAARFTITLSNNGDLPLTLSGTDPNSSPACIGSIPAQLEVGEQVSYECDSGSKTADFSTTLTVTGTYTLNDETGQITESSTVEIDVINPALSILSHGPTEQSVPFGGTAVFTTTVQNSGDVSLSNILLAYPNTPACDETISQLAATQTETFTCTAPNILEEFNNPITVTAHDPLDNELQAGSTAAFVDLIPLLTLSKTAVPEQLPEPGGDVTFSLEISNPTNETLTLTSLTNVMFGNLQDEENTAVSNNSCPALSTIPAAELAACQFSATISGSPGDVTSQTIATAEDDDGNTIQDNDAATVTINNLPPTLTLTLEANPTAIEEPRGEVTFNLTIRNSSVADTVLLTSIVDSQLGNLVEQGKCLPLAILSINELYQCEYTKIISGVANESQEISLSVNGLDEEETAVSQTESVTITITPPVEYKLYLPILTHNFRTNDEPNNFCNTAFPITVGQPYSFFPNDINDWYSFGFNGGDLAITLDNFTPLIGQIILWHGGCGQLELIANNGNDNLQKVIQQPNLPAGNYFIWVIADGSKSNSIPYELTVSSDLILTALPVQTPLYLIR